MAPAQLIQDFLANPNRIIMVDSEDVISSIQNTAATLVRRIPDTIIKSKRAASKCTGTANECQLPTDNDNNDTNLIIALGIAIPLSVAALAFYLMWRRSRKRQQREDEKDRNASLDFGLGDQMQKGPEVTESEKLPQGARSRGMSLEDMMGAPFVSPSSLYDSRGSVHSLSRVSDSHDPYRPIHMMRNSSQLSLSRPPTYHSRPTSGRDNASIWTSASGSTAATSDKKSLIMNALSPSRTSLLTASVNSSSSTSSSTSTSNSPPDPSPIEIPESAFIAPGKPMSPVNGGSVPPASHRITGSDRQGTFLPRESVQPALKTASLPAAPAAASTTAPVQIEAKSPIETSTSGPTTTAAPILAPAPIITSAPSASPVAASIPAPASVAVAAQASAPQPDRPIPSIEKAEQAQPPQHQRQPQVPSTPGRGLPRSQSGRRHSSRPRNSSDSGPASPSSAYHEGETYADVLGIAQKETRSPPLERYAHPTPMPTVPEGGPAQSGLGLQGVQYETRQTTPGSPDNAEQRANRVRSFYKEYFDHSSPPPARGHHAHRSSSYSQDYNQEHFYGAPIYDPATGQFIMAGAPYAQPMNRRAMTPPPRAPPKSFRNSPAPSGQYPPQRPRGYSSVCAAPRHPGTPNSFGASRGRSASRRIQPPAPLTVLPNPAQMTDDSALFSPTDFAPPMTARSRAASGGSRPRGGERVPYSPGARAFSPLVSSFDDLAFMPSPHALRKSASFTHLDFAAPKRFGASSPSMNGTPSDAGSVRSGRSHGTSVSAAQLANIRAGAYRLSRVPRDVVGSRDDMMMSLRPRMDLASARA